MPTIAEIDAEIAKRQEAQRLNAAVDAEIARRLKEQEPKGALAEIESAFQKIPGAPTLSEFAAGFNRSALGVLDFLGPDNLNAIANLAGIEGRVPTFQDTFGSEGGFMDEGLARDIVAGAGEVAPAALGVGALVRRGAQALPSLTAAPEAAAVSQGSPRVAQALAPGAESTSAGLLRQAGQTTAAQDLGFGVVSGGGAVFGEDVAGPVGELVGSILAPVSAQAATSGLKALLGLGGKGISILSKSIENMSDDGAAQLLSEAMVREGISPEDFAKQLTQLGPEAIPADVGNNFARLLRVASNKVPRIEGRASDVFRQRHAGQSDRIIDALDDASGTSSLNVADEIERLNVTLGPKIKGLYDGIRGGNIGTGMTPASGIRIKGTKINQPPSRLPFNIKRLFEGNNSVSVAAKKAQGALNDRVALGDRVGDIDLIDETKKVMDDQIGKALRMGENNRVRMLVRLKNNMVTEADNAIPQYKAARDLFAGKAQLESAADAGTLFVKLKPRELNDLTKTYGTSEKKMFKLGAKQAILDKVDSLQMNADAVKRLFGKNGDVKKLRTLFDDTASFNRFSDALERESKFIATRNAAQANSTTAKQLADEGTAEEVFGETISLLGSPIQSATTFGRILSGLSGRKGSEAFTRSLEKAGDILLTRGMDAKKIESLLRRGAPNEIENALRNIMIRPLDAAPASLAGGAGVVQDNKP
jgi:hypothetical protein